MGERGARTSGNAHATLKPAVGPTPANAATTASPSRTPAQYLVPRVSLIAGTGTFATRDRSALRGWAWDALNGRSHDGLSGCLVRSAALADRRVCAGW